MAVCTPAGLSDFVSDCADVVCAGELIANYFLDAVSSRTPTKPPGAPRSVFPSALVGAGERCGSVDLSVWLSSHSPSSPGIGATAGRYAKERGAAVSSATAAAAASTPSSPTYLWRPIVLAVLCAVLLVLIMPTRSF